MELLVAIIALLISVVGVWYTRRALWPQKREITLSTLPPASLLSVDSTVVTGLKVTHNGSELKEPYIVTITIEGTGRFDISRTAFDGGNPIEIELGAQIIDILQQNDITTQKDGSKILLGPDLLKRGQVSSVQMLTEGRPNLAKFKSKIDHDLVDVSVTVKSSTDRRKIYSPEKMAIALTFIIAIPAAGVTLFLLTNLVQPHVKISPTRGAAGSKAAITGRNYNRYTAMKAVTNNIASPGDQPLTLGEAQVDENGYFRIVINIPKDAKRGNFSINVKDDLNGSNYVYFSVTAP